MTPKGQLKSKQRVSDHGEVFTSEREVAAMLDLVAHETDRIDSRFLEPACGTGNFLYEILQRKLIVVKRRYKRSQIEYERYALLAVSSVYGIDVLEDNVAECQLRLLTLFENEYKKQFKQSQNTQYLDNIKFIIGRNILWGDALTLMLPDNTETPIVFSEWSAINGSMIKRRDYTLANLLAYQPMEEPNLFSDLGDQAFIPKSLKEFPLTHFMDLINYAE